MANRVAGRLGTMLAILIGSSLPASADGLYKLVDLGRDSAIRYSIDNDGNAMRWKTDPLPTNGYSVGWIGAPDKPNQPVENYLRQGDSDTNLLPQALRTPGKVMLTGVNSDGIVIGNSYTQDGGSSFYYDVKTGQLHDFSRLPTQTPRDQLVIYGINSLGQAVGTAIDATGQHAIYFPTLSSTPIDLQQSLIPNTNWQFVLASGINDRGQIVGFGGIPISYSGFFRLDPYPVPEPSTTIFFAAMALTALAGAARRGKSASR